MPEQDFFKYPYKDPKYIIKSYFEVYIEPRFNDMFNIDNDQIKNILIRLCKEAGKITASDYQKLLKRIYQNNNNSIAFFTLYKCLISGELNEEAPLIQNLKKADVKLSIGEMNKLISQELISLVDNYFINRKMTPIASTSPSIKYVR